MLTLRGSEFLPTWLKASFSFQILFFTSSITKLIFSVEVNSWQTDGDIPECFGAPWWLITLVFIQFSRRRWWQTPFSTVLCSHPLSLAPSPASPLPTDHYVLPWKPQGCCEDCLPSLTPLCSETMVLRPGRCRVSRHFNTEQTEFSLVKKTWKHKKLVNKKR